MVDEFFADKEGSDEATTEGSAGASKKDLSAPS